MYELHRKIYMYDLSYPWLGGKVKRVGEREEEEEELDVWPYYHLTLQCWQLIFCFQSYLLY